MGSSVAGRAVPAVRRVSPTAKTQDLGLKKGPGATPARGASSASPVPRRAAPPANANTSPRRASPITVPDPPAVASTRFAPAGRSAVAPGVHPALKQEPAPAHGAAGNGRVVAPVRAPGGARLIAVSEGGAQFGLNGSRVVIGRSTGPGAEDLDIDLSRLTRGVDRVSRRHAEIVLRGEDYFIRDLGSLNGTYVAGRGRLGRDQLYRLNDRDEIVLGGAKLEFRKG